MFELFWLIDAAATVFVGWCLYHAIKGAPVAEPKNVTYTDKSWQL